jgi:hypothetical protein
MVRRFYIGGGNGVGDPAVGASTIVDPYFTDRVVTGVFKEGDRYFIPDVEWKVDPLTPDTLEVINGSSFALNEVFIVEVNEKKNGVTFVPGDCSDDVDPYLPDIIKCVVAKVNSVFENREDDSFSVHYDHGIYEQVGSDKLRSSKGYLFVWLVMPFIEESPLDNSYYADATCKILIATSTDSNYTQVQREEINFHPRLIPVYKELIKQLQQEIKLDNSSIVKHQKRLLPYWGGGDMIQSGQPNLWKDYVDAIEISNLKLKIGHIKCCSFTSNF